MSYRIDELQVLVNLKGQVAQTRVSQSFVNTGSRQMEVSFVFPLPYEGAVDRMTFLVDGKEYPARLLTAAEARRIYEGHIRKNKDQALVEWIGTGLFISGRAHPARSSPWTSRPAAAVLSSGS